MDSLVTYLFVFALSALFIDQSKRFQRAFNALSIIGLFIVILFAAGRYHVGTDCNTYYRIFSRYAGYSWDQFFQEVDGEYLFSIIAKITFSIGGRVLTWGVFAALIVIPVYMALRDEYPFAALGTAYFFFLFSSFTTSFNVTRQMIAVAWVFWGLKFVFSNKFIPFLITLIVATLFHLSAPVAIFLWFLWDHKNNCTISGRRRVVFIVATAIAVYFYQNLITFLTTHIAALESYADYALTSYRGSNRDIILYLFELTIFIIVRGNLSEVDEKIDYMYVLLIISILIDFTGFRHPQVKRIAYYYSLPSRLVLFGSLPYAFTDNSKDNGETFAKILICIYAFALFVLTAYVLGEADLIPYRFDLFSAW